MNPFFRGQFIYDIKIYIFNNEYVNSYIIPFMHEYVYIYVYTYTKIVLNIHVLSLI